MSVMQEQEPVRSRRSFPDEFKRDAVALVIDEGRKVIDVALSLGVGEGTLGNWRRRRPPVRAGWPRLVLGPGRGGGRAMP